MIALTAEEAKEKQDALDAFWESVFRGLGIIRLCDWLERMLSRR